MSSAVQLERFTPGHLFQSSSGTQLGNPAAPQTSAPSWNMLPRCQFTFKKCANGYEIRCCCDDEVACGMLQHLCRMLCDGTCCCTVTCNGNVICQCNLTLGFCKCVCTEDGVCISCTSGDEQCCAMLQSCCDFLACCCQNGCCCSISFGGTPVCCGTC